MSAEDTKKEAAPEAAPPEKAPEKAADAVSDSKEESAPASDKDASVDTKEKAAEERIQKKKDSDELTKRLQKLALERQKQSTGDNKNRLKVIQNDQSSHLSSAKTFDELDLPKHLLDAIYGMGFDRPSAIQEEALPRILADPPRNLIGQAQAGSGKTAAFALGMLYRIKVDSPATTQALCVTPTRELAIQIVEKAIKPLGMNMEGLKIRIVVQDVHIKRGESIDAHLVVGTPGKVCQFLKLRCINAKTIKVFCLDEADVMVEEGGHRANSLLIKKAMPKYCQSLFFSATFPKKVVDFAEKMVYKPDKILIEQGPEFLVVDNIRQLWVDTRDYEGGKIEFLSDIYSLMSIGQSIVFVQTRNQADKVARTLTESGYECSVLHGQIDPAKRDSTMEAFRNGESNVLITTNVLARGVDVDNVGLVVNYEVPLDAKGQPDTETYLHRIGRTGRFGRKGTAINLIHDDESIGCLAAIEKHYSPDKEMIKQVEADPEQLADNIQI